MINEIKTTEKKNMNFKTWLNTFISEKEIDVEQIIEVEGSAGMNMIPVDCVLETIKNAPVHEQKEIKNIFVKIDFANGDILHFIKHLAGAMAI